MTAAPHRWVSTLFALLCGWTTAAFAVPVFGPASAVTAFNTPSTDQLTDLSPDGLTATLQSNVSVPFRVFSSTRASLVGPWSAPSNADYVNTNAGINTGHAIMSPDGLELIYQQHPNIYVASRASTAVPFSAGTMNSTLSIGTSYTRPGKLSADGLRIYFEATDASNVNLFVSSRATLASPWGTPTQGPFSANVNTTGIESEPYVTPDELQLFFVSNRAGGAGSADIWWASRATTSDPFGIPVNVASVNTSSTDSSPELFGGTLFFTSTRSGNYDVYSTQMIPEPASLGVVVLLMTSLLQRRAK